MSIKVKIIFSKPFRLSAPISFNRRISSTLNTRWLYNLLVTSFDLSYLLMRHFVVMVTGSITPREEVIIPCVKITTEYVVNMQLKLVVSNLLFIYFTSCELSFVYFLLLIILKAKLFLRNDYRIHCKDKKIFDYSCRKYNRSSFKIKWGWVVLSFLDIFT